MSVHFPHMEKRTHKRRKWHAQGSMMEPRLEFTSTGMTIVAFSSTTWHSCLPIFSWFYEVDVCWWGGETGARVALFRWCRSQPRYTWAGPSSRWVLERLKMSSNRLSQLSKMQVQLKHGAWGEAEREGLWFWSKMTGKSLWDVHCPSLDG